MKSGYGIEKPELQALPKIQDRITFVYLEHCKISRQDGAIAVFDDLGTVHIPAATISVLLLGPGTDISHRAMELIGDMGITAIWVGEHGVRYYAHGRALSNHSRLLLKQAEMVSNARKHIAVARKMYQLRFPNEDVSTLTMQQLRGREGSRVRRIYRECAQKFDIEWRGREYIPGEYKKSNPVNQALSSGNACLYGVAHAVISALGCSPGLGFVHVGHELSFVYDVADLYKAEIIIPVAFETAAGIIDESEDVGRTMRRNVRDKMKQGHILDRMVHDIQFLLSEEGDEEDFKSTLYLWDNGNELPHGVSYREAGRGVE